MVKTKKGLFGVVFGFIVGIASIFLVKTGVLDKETVDSVVKEADFFINQLDERSDKRYGR